MLVSTAEYRKRIKSANFHCIGCGADLTEVDWEIDHIHPKSRGGRDDPSNFQILCRSCNASKNNKTMAEWKPWLLKEDGSPIKSWRELGWIPPSVSLGYEQSRFSIGDSVRVFLPTGSVSGVCIGINIKYTHVLTVDNEVIRARSGLVGTESDIRSPEEKDARLKNNRRRRRGRRRMR